MTTLRERSFTPELDRDAAIALLLESQESPLRMTWPTVAILRRFLAEPELNRAQSTRIWTQTTGMPRALGLMWHGPYLVALVPPREDIATVRQVLWWAGDRIREEALAHGEPLRLWAECRTDDAERIALFEAEGFQREESEILQMVRPLDAPLPDVRLPPGFTLRPLDGEHEIEEWVALHDAAFGVVSALVARRRAILNADGYVRELDLVVVAPDGRLAAFCEGSISWEENTATGRREGWSDPIGTHPAYQRRGLARAVTTEVLRRLRAAGMTEALLYVTSGNIAARALYQSLGYETRYRICQYVRAFGPGIERE